MLRLTEGEDGLWERFLNQRDPRPESASIVPRWVRATELGVHPDGPAHPIGVRGHELAARRDAVLDVLAEGTGVVQALEAEVSARGLLAIVTDPHGVIVRTRGGESFMAAVKRSRLVEGMRWDEGARGTNAIGTALAENAPVAVIGRGHWESVNHGLFCYASPVFDPFGDRVAIIDVTGPVQSDAPALGIAVRSAAAAIEQVLLARTYARSDAGSRSLVERMMAKCSSPVVLVEAPGVIAGHNGAAAAEFELEPLARKVPVERLFGVGWGELIHASGSPIAFETRRRRFSVELQPVLADGRILAFVCFFSESPPPRAALVQSAVRVPPAFDGIFGRDEQVQSAKQRAAALARSDLPVLLLSETGTGKELFAQAIHRASPRSLGPFIPINCGALSNTLLESELFGYGPGAFTGARPQGAEGKIAAAHRGTLFLDEVAEMSSATQAMLLRFLEDGSYSRIGEVATRRADVRVVCATCRDLPRLVREGAFRKDLFFRIQGGCVTLPLLRDRTDRLELARRLLDEAVQAHNARAQAGAEIRCELGPSAEAWVLDHAWPGNVRELKTALAHAVVLSGGGSIGREHFPEPLLLAQEDSPGDEMDAPRDAAMRELAVRALQRARGNKSEAARAIGVARSTFYRMIGRR